MFLSINLFEEKYTLRISLSFCASIRKRERERERASERASERENENERERERERERDGQTDTEREKISFVDYIVNFSWVKLILIYRSSVRIFIRKKLYLTLEKLTKEIVRTRE